MKKGIIECINAQKRDFIKICKREGYEKRIIILNEANEPKK